MATAVAAKSQLAQSRHLKKLQSDQRPVREMEMYKSSSSANQQERDFRHSQHQAKMARQREEIRAQMRAHSGSNTLQFPAPTRTEEPHPSASYDVQGSNNTNNFVPPPQSNMQATDPRRRAARMKRLKAAAQKVRQRQAAKQRKDREELGRKIIWDIIGPGGAVEAEGAAGWSWFGTGGFASIYTSIKTLMMTEDEPDFLGKFGFLRFLEPPRQDPNDPSSYIVHLYSIGWFFVFILAHVIGFFLMMVLTLQIMVWANLISTFLGPMFSFFGSMKDAILFL
jgi:hypothetical protein